MIDFGFDKIALIGAVALIVIGPEKLPRVARTVGHFIGKAQRYVADVKAEVNRSIELDELKKMKGEFEDAARNVERSVSTEINQASAEFEKSWSETTAAYESLPEHSGQARGPAAAGARIQAPAEELAAEAGRHTAVVQAAPRGACEGAVRRRPGRPFPPAFTAPMMRQRASGAAPAGWATARLPVPFPADPPVGRATALSANDPQRDELEGTEQPFVTHLVELRDRLIRAVVAVGICFAGLAFWPGPSGLYDLLASPLVAQLPAGATLIAHQRDLALVVPLKITLLAAFLLALPVVLYQVWAFVAPGLYNHEKKLVLPLVVSSTLLFFLGVAFCYFFVFGQVFKFIRASHRKASPRRPTSRPT